MKIKFLKANNGDSILISFSDEMDIKRNILIDGGMPQTYYNSGENIYGELYHTIENIKKIGEKIDLLIITHIDEDHIGGILNWFALDEDAYKLIDKVWFNSGKAIAKHFAENTNEDLDLPLNIFATNFTSVKQGKLFEEYIKDHVSWNEKIIKSKKQCSQNGIKIQILSPNDTKLKGLLKEYKRPINKYFTASSGNDWGTSIIDFIEEEKDPLFRLEKDNSPSNGSSIAFLLTFNKKKFLFLGDSHPEIIIESLKDLGATKEDPIEVEFVKVSHHGSCKNTNKELLEIIKTNNYMISTSSQMHNHPDKRTLARIIDRNPNVTIYFNYEFVKEEVFNKNDFEEYENLFAKNISEYIID